MIYTIGYQRNTIEDIERIMTAKNIGLLVDVRSVPYSRNPAKREFNKNRMLQRFCGSCYFWLGEICGGKKGPVGSACIRKLLELATKEDLLLMCLENHPFDCHRYYDIGKRLLDPGRVDAVHIFDGTMVKTSVLMEAQRCQKK
jgi:uncharacterized protein (DUF488 family)